MRLPEKIQNALVNSIIGLQVHFTADNVEYSYAIIKLVKKEATLIDSGSCIEDINELSNKLPKGLPVWIALTGRGIIARKLEAETDKHLLQQLLPNARKEDFYLSQYRNTTGSWFATAIRKNQADEVLNQLKEEGFPVLGMSVGCMDVTVVTLSGIYTNDEVVCASTKIIFSNSEPTDIETVQKPGDTSYSVDNYNLDSKTILPFALALGYFTRQTTSVNENLTLNQDEYIFRLANKYGLFGALGIVFLLLLINFVAFSGYNSKNNELTEKLTVYQTMFSQRDSLQKEIFLKNKLIEESGLTQQSMFSFYADQLASTVPSGITLSELTINPLTEKIKKGNPIHFIQHIYLSGACTNSIVLNDWISSIEMLDWAKDVELINYERSEGNGKFELQINY